MTDHAQYTYNSIQPQRSLSISSDDMPTQTTSSALGLTGIRCAASEGDRCVEGRTVDEIVTLILDGSEDLYPNARMHLASQEPWVLTTLYSSLHAYDLELHATILEYLLEVSNAAKSTSMQDDLRAAALTKALYWSEYHFLSPSKAEAAWNGYQRTAGQRSARRRRLKTDTAKPAAQSDEEATQWACSYHLSD